MYAVNYQSLSLHTLPIWMSSLRASRCRSCACLHSSRSFPFITQRKLSSYFLRAHTCHILWSSVLISKISSSSQYTWFSILHFASPPLTLLSSIPRRVLRITRRAGVPLIINDRVDVALAIGAGKIMLFKLLLYNCLIYGVIYFIFESMSFVYIFYILLWWWLCRW